MGGRYLQLFQSGADALTACGNGTAFPPVVQRSTVHLLLANRNTYRKARWIVQIIYSDDGGSCSIQREVDNRNVFMHEYIVHYVLLHRHQATGMMLVLLI